MQINNLNEILTEILPIPSQQIQMQRFADKYEDAAQAGCNGVCESAGGCKGILP